MKMISKITIDKDNFLMYNGDTLSEFNSYQAV